MNVIQNSRCLDRDCIGKPVARGMCRKHYTIWYESTPRGRKARKNSQANARKKRRVHGGYSTPEKALAYWRKRRGIPTPPYQDPGRCECCGGPPRGRSTKNLSVDHDHETGKFRGFLCGPCNIGIGALGDNLPGLERAVAYLKNINERYPE